MVASDHRPTQTVMMTAVTISTELSEHHGANCWNGTETRSTYMDPNMMFACHTAMNMLNEMYFMNFMNLCQYQYQFQRQGQCNQFQTDQSRFRRSRCRYQPTLTYEAKAPRSLQLGRQQPAQEIDGDARDPLLAEQLKQAHLKLYQFRLTKAVNKFLYGDDLAHAQAHACDSDGL